LLNLLGRKLGMLLLTNILERFERNIGIDRFGAVTSEHTEMMHFPRFASFNDESGLHSQPLADQVVMDRSGRQQCRHRDAVLALCTVRQNKNIVVLQDRFGGRPAHFLERKFDPLDPALGVPGDVNRCATKRAVEHRFHRTDLSKIFVGQDWLLNLKSLVRPRIMAKQVRARANHGQQAHHQFFADWIDRRIGHLREVLLEIVEQQP